MITEEARLLVEEISIAARESELVDQTSGVSARVAISAIELLASISSAGRSPPGTARSIRGSATCRLSCRRSPASSKWSTKVSSKVPRSWRASSIGTAVKKLFDSKFPPPDSGRPTQRRREDVEEGLEDAGARRIRPAPEKIHPLYEPIVEWFANGGKVTISDDTPFPEHFAVLDGVPGLRKAVEERFAPASSEECAVGMELVLEGLTQHLKIAREDLDSKVSYMEMLKFNLVTN